jgi:phosphoesterase RecJ-like protein
MIYQVPDRRCPQINDVLRAVSRASRIILTTHVNADGDGAGSEVALAAWLREAGKEAWIINPTAYPESVAFLLPEKSWVVEAGSARAQEISRNADLAVILDTSEASRIGRVMRLVKQLPKVIVDHHPAGFDSLEGVSLCDPEACATGELVFDLVVRAGGPLPEASALGIYVAVLTDTGSFRFSNASPSAHRIVAELLEMGVDPEKTYRRVYGNVPVRKLVLLRAALGELEVDAESGLAWMTVPRGVVEELKATPDDIEGLVDYPRGIQGVEVGLLFRETARGATKVSFRSNGEVDVNAVARRFGGGGHVKASGALVQRPLPEVRDEVIRETRRSIRESLGDGRGGGTS